MYQGVYGGYPSGYFGPAQYAPQQSPTTRYAPRAAFEEIEGPDSIHMIPMGANERRVFFDKHRDRFYTVETDAAGQKAVEVYDFAMAKDEPEHTAPDYTDRLKDIEKRLDDIEQLVLS